MRNETGTGGTGISLSMLTPALHTQTGEKMNETKDKEMPVPPVPPALCDRCRLIAVEHPGDLCSGCVVEAMAKHCDCDICRSQDVETIEGSQLPAQGAATSSIKSPPPPGNELGGFRKPYASRRHGHS